MRPLPLVALSAAMLVLVACAGDASPTAAPDPTAQASDTEDVAEPDTTPEAGAFPVTITHAFGETVIPEPPERIATVAWANHEVPLALGVVPVGMAAVSWGDDDGDGVMPWVTERLEELGAEVPVLFDETDGIDFEAVAATEPDLILATYSGLSGEEYDTLSRIAPVVAYPEVAWATSVQDMILLSSQAMGRADDGQALVAGLEDRVATAVAEHPDLAGQRVLFGWFDTNDFSSIGFYTLHDTRPGFLADAGLQIPQVVTDATAASDAFFDTISAEQADLLDDVDVIVTYGRPDGSTVAALQADPLLSQVDAIADGAVAILADSTPLAAAANPSPLSIDWALDDYLAILADATRR